MTSCRLGYFDWSKASIEQATCNSAIPQILVYSLPTFFGDQKCDIQRINTGEGCLSVVHIASLYCSNNSCTACYLTIIMCLLTNQVHQTGQALLCKKLQYSNLEWEIASQIFADNCTINPSINKTMTTICELIARPDFLWFSLWSIPIASLPVNGSHLT